MVGALAPVTIDPALDRHGRARTDDGADPERDRPRRQRHRPDGERPARGAGRRPTRSRAADDDEERDEGPKGALTHPSSMGLRFQVPRDCGVLTVTASWGRYESFRKENDDGRKFQWSRRIPFEKTAEIDVRDHDAARRLRPITLDDDVTLRVELFPRDDRMIVELALSNDRVTGMDAPPGDWLFQTKLQVEANSGEAVFLPTRDVLARRLRRDRRGASAARPAVPAPARVRHRSHRVGRPGPSLRRRR